MERYRLRDLDLESVAHGAMINLAVDVTRKLTMLYKSVAVLPSLDSRHSAVYRSVLALGEYARGGELRAPYEKLMEPVRELYRSWFFDEVNPLDVESAEPNTPLGLILLAAAARYRLDCGSPLGCADLAALVSVDRDYIIKIAPEIPDSFREDTGNKRWWFKPSDALKQWIEERTT